MFVQRLNLSVQCEGHVHNTDGNLDFSEYMKQKQCDVQVCNLKGMSVHPLPLLNFVRWELEDLLKLFSCVMLIQWEQALFFFILRLGVQIPIYF